MSKIKKIKKQKKGMYTLECHGDIFDVNENTIIKLNLLSDAVKCQDIKTEIEFYNDYYQIYNLCLNKYARKMMSELEFRKLINKHTTNNTIEDMIIDELKNNKIIDDNKYLNMYLSTYADNGKYSSYRIRNELEKLGINILEHDFMELYELDFDKASNLIQYHLKKISGSKYEILSKCRQKLMSYYYSNEVINEVLNDLEYDEVKSLRSNYDNFYRKYGESIEKKLLNKGYKRETIKIVKEEMNDKH